MSLPYSIFRLTIFSRTLFVQTFYGHINFDLFDFAVFNFPVTIVSLYTNLCSCYQIFSLLFCSNPCLRYRCKKVPKGSTEDTSTNADLDPKSTTDSTKLSPTSPFTPDFFGSTTLNPEMTLISPSITNRKYPQTSSNLRNTQFPSPYIPTVSSSLHATSSGSDIDSVTSHSYPSISSSSTDRLQTSFDQTNPTVIPDLVRLILSSQPF